MHHDLNLKPFKPQILPQLTSKQKENWVKFCKERKHWTADDWKRVIFSDEALFELFHHSNRQTDRVWASQRDEVILTESVKHPLKIQLWGLMSCRALEKLYIIPKGQMVDAKYYVEGILEKSRIPDVNRHRADGSVLQRKLLPDMSEAIFQQDGAPAHHSQSTQNWL